MRSSPHKAGRLNNEEPEPGCSVKNRMNRQAPGLPDHQQNKIITSNLHYYRERVKPRYILHTRFNPTENNIDQLLISFREYAVGKYFPYDISDYYQRLQY
ncbi:hypothetical protein GTPT_0060 [Tatumella ptyseos ATCC 33301]|uniref:Uncharacterized protein n=2 Tax=Tatumella ptyseos TaxID=82987 RepID=A0A085JPU1_9GAMM|nr:hypothetical protein GTPT_0060 [Tatumella ptyseos ATCC 33301]SQK72250.1 Uncharacterised protein [Tatumella ptyseos]